MWSNTSFCVVFWSKTCWNLYCCSLALPLRKANDDTGGVSWKNEIKNIYSTGIFFLFYFIHIWLITHIWSNYKLRSTYLDSLWIDNSNTFLLVLLWIVNWSDPAEHFHWILHYALFCRLQPGGRPRFPQHGCSTEITRSIKSLYLCANQLFCLYSSLQMDNGINQYSTQVIIMSLRYL